MRRVQQTGTSMTRRSVAADDVYLCPAGEQLTYHYTNEQDGKTLHRYWTTACEACALKSKCTTGKERRISRLGSTRPSWRSCRRGSIEVLKKCACAVKLWSIRSAR